MDPDATLATMRDESADPLDRHEAALNLIRWINGGGFLPSTGYGFGGNTATKFVLLGECRKVAAEAEAALLADADTPSIGGYPTDREGR